MDPKRTSCNLCQNVLPMFYSKIFFYKKYILFTIKTMFKPVSIISIASQKDKLQPNSVPKRRLGEAAPYFGVQVFLKNMACCQPLLSSQLAVLMYPFISIACLSYPLDWAIWHQGLCNKSAIYQPSSCQLSKMWMWRPSPVWQLLYCTTVLFKVFYYNTKKYICIYIHIYIISIKSFINLL